MNQMEIFKNPEFGSVRVIEENGKYLFCGLDVTAALGYKDSAKALKAHCTSDGWAFYPLIDNVCVGIVYISGLVLGLISMVIALLGVAVLLTCSLQNGIILLVMAFLISPFGLPLAAIWLLGKVQDLKFLIQDLVYG